VFYEEKKMKKVAFMRTFNYICIYFEVKLTLLVPIYIAQKYTF